VDVFKSMILEKFPNVTIEVRAEQKVKEAFPEGFFFAKEASKPEFLLVAKIPRVGLVGLLAGEAKSLAASDFVAMPQAVHLSADSVRRQVEDANLNAQQAACPFIIQSGDSLIVGGCSCLPRSCAYPHLLSPSMSVISQQGRSDVKKWLYSVLLEVCWPVLESLIKQTHTSQPNNPQAILLVSSLFWKPVLRNETLPNRRLALDMQRMWPSEIGQLFRVFGLMWECEEAREFAVFPLGILRLPPLDKQVPVSGALRAAMRGATGGWKFHVLDGYTEDATELCGLPVVAYERLDESWIFGMPDDVDLLEMWIEAIKRSMDAFLAAGVVHLDLRPQNTAFRVDSQGLKVRVVDWDFSGVLGEVLSDDVTAFLSEDKRFPNITRASKDAHLWFWGWMKRCVVMKQRGDWGHNEFNRWVIDEVDEGRGNLQDILKESEIPRDPA
jgi:hypothetical protein